MNSLLPTDTSSLAYSRRSGCSIFSVPMVLLPLIKIIRSLDICKEERKSDRRAAKNRYMVVNVIARDLLTI